MKISEILTKHGTDKTFNNRNGHCYGETYDNLFEKYKRDSKISILEVGVHHGNSLGAWKESFPNAFVCGIDMVDNRYPQYKKDELHFILGDIKDINIKSHPYISNKTFDVMIDDGSHYLPDVIFFIKNYIDLLSDDGCMIIEDVQNPKEWEDMINAIISPDYQMILKDFRKINYRSVVFLIIIKRKIFY